MTSTWAGWIARLETDELIEGRVADRECGRSCGPREDVGVVLAIVTHDPALDLDLVDKAVETDKCAQRGDGTGGGLEFVGDVRPELL